MDSRPIEVLFKMYAGTTELTVKNLDVYTGRTAVTLTVTDDRSCRASISQCCANSRDSLAEHIRRLSNGEDPGSFQDCLDSR